VAEKRKIVGLKGIDAAIKRVDGVLGNVNEQVQDIAVAIVEHGAGQGNGDMSRALTLCQMVKRHRSLNLAFLVGWFRHFGNCNVNLRANDGAGKVSLVSRDAKGYRGFDVLGAQHNNWFDAYDEKGEKAGWYQGPPPPEFQPETVGDIADRIQRFVVNTGKLLEKTETVNGKEVPAVRLAETDKQQVANALQFMSRIAATLARHEEIEQLGQKLAKTMEESEKDTTVVQIIRQPLPEQPKAEAPKGDEQKEQAVA
jgi:hypothetical protein